MSGRTPLHADTLNEALPYIQAFRGQTFVVKYGGSAMRDRAALEGIMRNVLLLQLVGVRLILVHGGGPEIDVWLDKLGIRPQKLNGLRITDEATMDVVEMALGRANKALVAEVQRLGGRAVGLSGRDADLLQAVPISHDLGRVGAVTRVDPSVLNVVTAAGLIPIVCSVATDSEHRPLNVNADTAAGAIAAAVKASKLILLTDTDGVLEDPKRPDSTISTLTPADAERMLRSGQADRGMIPKLESALHAVRHGVPSVHMINGSTPNSLLMEVLTDEGVGSMMTSV